MKKDLRYENLETILRKLHISSSDVILNWVDEQKLPVYVQTTSLNLPGQECPFYHDSEAAIFYWPISASEYFNEKIADYTMLVKPSVRWDQGRAKVWCKTLLLSSADDTPLTLNAGIALDRKYGRIDLNGPTGSFLWEAGWSFDEAKLRCDIEEVRALKNGKRPKHAKQKGLSDFDEGLLKYAGPKLKANKTIPAIANLALRNQEDFLYKLTPGKLPAQGTIEKHLRTLLKSAR